MKTQSELKTYKSGDYKYIYTADTETGDWETYFYHISEDPYEMNDEMQDPKHADLLWDIVDEVMNDYWNGVIENMAPEMPEIVSRVTYDIDWPADPWKPVSISPADTSVTMS